MSFFDNPDTATADAMATYNLDAIAPGVSAAVSTNRAEGESWIDAASRLIPTLVLADSQRRLLNVQLDRAQRGLAPLDSSQYGLGVSVGLSPDVSRAVLILAGVAAIGLLVYVTRSRR